MEAGRKKWGGKGRSPWPPQYEGNAPSYTCLTPTGKLYAIPSRAIAAFQPGTNEWPAGCLVGYRIDNLTYYGWWDDFPSGKLFIGYAPAINGNPRLGAEIYRLSEPVDSDQVYAGIEVNCEALIMRGALPDASLYGFEESQYYPPVASLPIAHFDVLENSPMLSPGCLGGEEEWCRIRYADHPYLNPEANDPISRYVQQNPCIIPTLIHYNFDPYELDSEWMEGFKDIVGAGVAIGLSPVIIGEVLKDLFCGIINRLQAANFVLTRVKKPRRCYGIACVFCLVQYKICCAFARPWPAEQV